MADVWVCPQCQARWHAQAGWCAGCGYGMVPQQPVPVNGQGTPIALAHEGLYAQTTMQMPPQEMPRLVTGLAPDPSQPTGVASSPYVQAGSASDLRQIQQQLYEAQTTIEALRRQAQESQQQLLTSVHQMLQPLAQWFASQGLQPTMQQLIPQTVAILTELTQQAARRVQTQQSGQATTQLSSLEIAMGRLTETIEALRVQMQQPVNIQEVGPTQMYSDAQLAQMERQLLNQPPSWGGR